MHVLIYVQGVSGKRPLNLSRSLYIHSKLFWQVMKLARLLFVRHSSYFVLLHLEIIPSNTLQLCRGNRKTTCLFCTQKQSLPPHHIFTIRFMDLLPIIPLIFIHMHVQYINPRPIVDKSSLYTKSLIPPRWAYRQLARQNIL